MIDIERIAKDAESLPSGRTNLEHKAQEYLDAVLQELRIGLAQATTSQLAINQIPFSTSKLRAQLGRYGNPQNYWWDWLHINHPLVTVVKVGNNKTGEKSMVYTHIDLDTILSSTDAEEVFELLYGTYTDEPDIFWVPADVSNLRRYITSTKQKLDGLQVITQEDTKYKGTLKRNLISATGLCAVAEYTQAQSGQALIPHIAKHSDFGRTYYRSLNLQNCHKTVREAALGKCYETDINNSVFAWKISHIPKQMFDDYPAAFSYTRELLHNKKQIRRQLCKYTFGEHNEFFEGLIKHVMEHAGEHTGISRMASGRMALSMISSTIQNTETDCSTTNGSRVLWQSRICWTR